MIHVFIGIDNKPILFIIYVFNNINSKYYSVDKNKKKVLGYAVAGIVAISVAWFLINKFGKSNEVPLTNITVGDMLEAYRQGVPPAPRNYWSSV